MVVVYSESCSGLEGGVVVYMKVSRSVSMNCTVVYEYSTCFYLALLSCSGSVLSRGLVFTRLFSSAVNLFFFFLKYLCLPGSSYLQCIILPQIPELLVLTWLFSETRRVLRSLRAEWFWNSELTL